MQSRIRHSMRADLRLFSSASSNSPLVSVMRSGSGGLGQRFRFADRSDCRSGCRIDRPARADADCEGIEAESFSAPGLGAFRSSLIEVTCRLRRFEVGSCDDCAMRAGARCGTQFTTAVRRQRRIVSGVLLLWLDCCNSLFDPRFNL